MDLEQLKSSSSKKGSGGGGKVSGGGTCTGKGVGGGTNNDDGAKGTSGYQLPLHGNNRHYEGSARNPDLRMILKLMM